MLGISFPPKLKERRQKRAKKEEEKKEAGLQPLTGVFGKVDKTQSVQKLSWVTLDDKKLVSLLSTDMHIHCFYSTRLVTCCT